MINENYTTNYEVACAILDKLENGGGSTGGNIIYPNEINFTSDMEIEEIDLSNIGSDKLRYLNAFAQNSQNLRKIKGLDNFKNVSNVLSISYLYQSASNLIDDGGLHTLPFSEKVKSPSSVFMKCGLPSIDISRWRVTYGSQLSQLFREAKATYINMSNQDFGATDLGTTNFDYCYNLEEVKCENTIFPALSFTYFAASTKLSKQSILDMFNQLPTASATVKIPRHILNNLTEDELLIATNKGWTVNA